MKKQTAVERLYEKMFIHHGIITIEEFNQAKEMEVAQKKEYFRIGWNANKHKTWNCEFYLIKHFNNETFKSE